jgi:hypothetical protein
MSLPVHPALDFRGLAVRTPDGVVAPGTRVRRSPGDPSCEACVHSMTGYCPAHPEFYVIPAPVPAESLGEAGELPDGLSGDAGEPDGLPGRDWRVGVR